MTQETSAKDPLEKFVAFAQAENWDFDSYQIADILWLWRQQQQDDSITSAEQSVAPSSSVTFSSQSSFSNLKKDFTQLPPPPDSLPITLKSTAQKAFNTPEPDSLPLSLPDTAFLRDTLKLGRIARPLSRKISSATQRELDIQRTVRDTAEYSLGSSSANLTIIPEYRPKQVRSLDVILIIEEWASMLLWKEMAAEIQEWLEQLGAFRDIKLYRMKWQEDLQKVAISPLYINFQSISAENLIDPRGERLILFFSDCTSPAWYQGRYNEVLKLWGTHQLVTLLSPFPEKLWERTALKKGWRVQLQSDHPRRPSMQWNVKTIPDLVQIQCDEAKLEKEIQFRLRLPILSLTPHSLAAWSQVVDGYSYSACAGRLLEVSPTVTDLPSPVISPEEDPEKAVQLFANTASPLAWQLIQKLAVVPINLAVIRIIQQELLVESTPVDVAEILLSGLLKATRTFDFTTDLSSVVFEFVANIRDILLKSLGESRAIAVRDKLLDYITKKLGKSTKEFEAELLTNPQQFRGKEGELLVRAFAMLSVQAYGKLGEEYRQKAEIFQNINEQLTGSDTPLINEAWQAHLQQIAQQYQLTLLETVTLKELFPYSQIDLPIHVVAERLNIASSTLYRCLSSIYSKFKVQYPNLFLHSQRNKLKALQQYLQSEYVNPSSESLITWYEESDMEIEVATIEVLSLLKAETVYVDRTGEIIRSEPVNAYYYEEALGENIEPLKMIAIPEGAFMMGSPKNEKHSDPQEKPQHQVTVFAFYISQTPITQLQWRAIASLPQEGQELEADPSRFKGDDLPVEKITWQDAIEFCARLSRYTRRKYRLPSEVEWEYACRAGTTTPFHFGETITSKLANYKAAYTYQEEAVGEYRKKTTPVKSFPPNAFGLYDLHGNVWEWCLDPWHKNYRGKPSKDGRVWDEDDKNDNRYQNILNNISVLLKDKRSHVTRGGSWYFVPRICRSAYRGNYVDYLSSPGFRVVCAL